MEKKRLKQIFNTTLLDYGFYKENKHYILDISDDLMVYADLQASSYSPAYYFNYGFCVKSINPELPLKSSWGCELTLRGNFNFGKESGLIEYEKITESAFTCRLKEIIEENIIPFKTEGINFLLSKTEWHIAFSLRLKVALGLE
jgi:hypothetical protein